VIRAGLLRKRIAIEAATETQNARGEAVQAWAAEATVYAFIEPLSGRELFTAQQRAADVTHRVTIRYRDERGTATGAQSSTTLQDTTKTWTPNAFFSQEVTIYGGTGAGQVQSVLGNTGNTLTVAGWSVTPDATSLYRINWLTPKKRINYAGRIFNILGILNIEERNHELEILVKEVF